jgi:diketogulonate reductase-like aldo/keto reductase
LPFLEELEGYTTITPALNQMEFTPFLFMKEELEYCQKNLIQLQSYSPLTKGEKLKDQRILALAEKYGKTPAQIVLRWNIQHSVSTIPKSSNAARLKENFDIFDFEISSDDMKHMDGFSENLRLVGDPLSML